MADNNEHDKSILKNDPDFTGLDFSAMRAEGIQHVAELSGKIWTDHNVHDPGITILEILCYALIDLGYRTRLPAVDIFSRDPADQSPDDNFFTPARILTCNPVTIMDFRKLLIDIKEVKNAWLELNDEWIDCEQPPVNDPVILNTAVIPVAHAELECSRYLNGLYKVYIELYKGPYTPEASWTNKEKEQIEAIVEKVRKVLMAHRNLCEDFVSIKILCKEKIGVCADIDLELNADAEKIYVRIIETLKSFFSPDPKYYTLQQLLDKGKAIDEIFAGRPYLPESHGFVDADELESIQFRKEIHVSDVYNELFRIQGIRTIRKLRLRKCGSTDNGLPGECDWKYYLTENHTAEFSLDCSGFRFTLNGVPVIVNEKKYKDFFLLNYSLAGKILHSEQFPALDLPVPKGIYRGDLRSYYSIQNEFPRVYGINEGGISDSASDLRKAQALQLKGYLLFFDQLLANYLAQLSQLRKLFALKNSSKEAVTYFSNLPEHVPDLDRLLRFGAGDVVADKGAIQAIPVDKTIIEGLIALDKLTETNIEQYFQKYKFKTAADRDAAVYTMIEDLQSSNYSVYTFQSDGGCWYFYIYTSSDQLALLGKAFYQDEKSARLAAINLSYIGTFRENYRSYTIDPSGPSDDSVASYFYVELNMSGYGVYLQQITEDKKLYQERRKAFLDHLLSRFAESFTDFALLSFDSLKEEKLKQQDLIKKSNFLFSYDSLGRDRGKGYDYKKNGWNNNNISGFEKRIKAYTGIDDCCGETLCHFEVFEYTGQFYWTISAAGKNIFKSNSMFDSSAEAVTDLESFIKALKEEDSYKTLSNPIQDNHSLSVEYNGDHVTYAGSRHDKDDAALLGKQLRQLLSATPGAEDIVVSNQIFRPQLINDRNEIVGTSKQAFETQSKAVSAAKHLVKKINEEEEWDHAGIDEKQKVKMDLKAAKGEPFNLIDIAHFTKNVTVCSDEYRWHLDNDAGNMVLTGTNTYPSRQIALESMINELTAYNISPEFIRYNSEEGKYGFELMNSDGSVLAVSPLFTEDAERNAAIDFVISFCEKEKNDQQYSYRIEDACHWQVEFRDDLVFQSLALLADPENAMNTWRKDKRAFREGENYLWDWDDRGQQRLSVKDEKNEIIARLIPQPGRDSLAEEIFSLIQSSLDRKTFIATTVKLEEGFGFRLRDNNDQVLLSGYQLYGSRGEAFFTMLRALEKAGHESSYLKSGDEGNRQYTFFLKNDESQFLAEHPLIYDSENERNGVLQNTIELLGAKHRPASGVKEPVRYTYNLSAADRLLLSSAQKFSSIREAGENANIVLILAGETSNYQFVKDVDSDSYEVRLISGDKWLASVPGKFADEIIAEGIRNEVVQSVRQHLYNIQITPFDDKWRFRISLGLGTDRVNFQSKEEFETDTAAIDAYKKMAEDMGNLKIQKIEGRAELFSKQKINKTNITAIALPDDAKSATQNSESAADTALAISQVLYNVANTEDKKLLQKMVKKDDLAEQGTWTYRLVKKDDFLAYHIDCSDENPDPRNQIKNLHAAVNGKPDYLLICLGGTDVLCKRKGSIIYDFSEDLTGEVFYHYVIRARNKSLVDISGKEPVIFISTQGYSSPEDAAKAFEENYLLILKRASKAFHYGDGKFISLTETFLKSGDQCSMKGRPVVYVPREIIDHAGNETVAIEWLTELAKSYPIRLSGKDGFKFSLYDYNKKLSYFISAAYYTSAMEAMKAFLFFLVLAKNRKNYYMHCDPDTGNTFIVIREVLLESTRRFLTSEEAWGSEGIEKLIGISQTEGSFHISVNSENCCFSFFVSCKPKLVHPCIYDSPKSRNLASTRLYREFSNYQLPLLPEVKLTAGNNYYEVWYEGKLLAELPKGSDKSLGGLCTSTFLDFLNWVISLGQNVKIKDGDQYILRNEDGEEMAHLTNPAITEAEWIKKLVSMALSFPVFKKDNTYYFRIPYLSETENLDDSIYDACGCGKEVPTESCDCYVAWIGGCYNTCDEAFNALKALPEKFRNENNYRTVFDCTCGSYRIEFIEEDDIIAVNPQCYSNREMVCEAADRARNLINCEGMHLVEHILLRPRCEEHCDCLIPDFPDDNCNFKWETNDDDPCKPANADPCFTPGADPYSCIATIVLPAWPMRFKKQANRELISRILHREAPSHILLRILWLSPRDFCNFESRFKSWVRWLANKKNYCGPPFNMCSFIDLLFEDDLECWWPQDYCEPCKGDIITESPCKELNNQADRADACRLTVNDVFGWSTPDCCFEYRRINLKPEEKNEKTLTIRKRSASYLEKLEMIHKSRPEDENIGQAISYVKGNKPDEEKLIRISRLLTITNGDKEKQKLYKETLDTLLAYYLDRSLLDEYDSNKLSDIKRTIQKLSLKKQEVPLILKNWNTGDLNKFVHVKTFEALNGIFNRK